jgi:tetratricopeptide (TPR) repeat protein
LLFYKKGDYTQALQFQSKALKLNESINNQYGIAINQSNLGNIYSETNYPKLAEEAYLKSLQASNETGNTLQITRCLVNIGVLKYNQKLYNAAIKQFQEALVFARSIGHHELTADCHNNIGAIYKEQNKLDSALLYLEEGLKTRQMIDDEFELADSYNNIAMVYILQKNFSQASNYIALSQEICAKFDYTDALLELYHTQSEFYSAQQNFEQANIYLKKHYALKDSISNLGKELKSLIFTDNSSKNETTKPKGNSKYGFIIILLILLIGIPLFLIRFKR